MTTSEPGVAEPLRRAVFERFVRDVEPRLRRALVAAYGGQRGREATAEALSWAWENWDRIRRMENPSGYVYRVGETAGRKLARRPEMRIDFSIADDQQPMVEPGLAPALLALSERQRVVVVMIHAVGWTHRETADLLGLSTSSVQKHLERGLARLRRSLGVEIET